LSSLSRHRVRMFRCGSVDVWVGLASLPCGGQLQASLSIGPRLCPEECAKSGSEDFRRERDSRLSVEGVNMRFSLKCVIKCSPFDVGEAPVKQELSNSEESGGTVWRTWSE